MISLGGKEIEVIQAKRIGLATCFSHFLLENILKPDRMATWQSGKTAIRKIKNNEMAKKPDISETLSATGNGKSIRTSRVGVPRVIGR